MTVVRRDLALVAMAALVPLGLVACGGGGGGSKSGGGGKTIALLLPETKTTRYEAHDRPNFQAKVKRLCSDCKILYANASQDASKQQTQAEAFLTKGADVLVLDAVDVGSGAPTIREPKQRDGPVIAYARRIPAQKLDY